MRRTPTSLFASLLIQLFEHPLRVFAGSTSAQILSTFPESEIKKVERVALLFHAPRAVEIANYVLGVGEELEGKRVAFFESPV